MERKLRAELPSGEFANVSIIRSRTMAAIRGKHNRTTELALRMALIRAGISGWRLHPSDLPGRPDLFFGKERVAIFVDGCFWHGCPRCGHIPKTRSNFWRAKIRRNRRRHTFVGRQLLVKRIRVMRIWEHELQKPHLCIQRIVKTLKYPLSKPPA